MGLTRYGIFMYSCAALLAATGWSESRGWISSTCSGEKRELLATTRIYIYIYTVKASGSFRRPYLFPASLAWFLFGKFLTWLCCFIQLFGMIFGIVLETFIGEHFWALSYCSELDLKLNSFQRLLESDWIRRGGADYKSIPKRMCLKVLAIAILRSLNYSWGPSWTSLFCFESLVTKWNLVRRIWVLWHLHFLLHSSWIVVQCARLLRACVLHQALCGSLRL